MSGNKSVVSNERKALLRALFERHGYCLEQLELVSGIAQNHLDNWCSKEKWNAGFCVLLQAETTDTLCVEGDSDLQAERKLLTASMVRASRFLRHNLDQQTDADDQQASNLNNEGRVKEIVSITKAIQVLEGLIENMETPKDEASQYPQDTLEFHRILTKQIENLTNQGTAG